MKNLSYSTVINAPVKVVWRAFTDPELYKKWSGIISEKSQFKGELKKGSYVKYFDPDLGGSLAFIEDFELFKTIKSIHIAVFAKDSDIPDRSSNGALGWIGTQTNYSFEDLGGSTRVRAEIKAHQDYVPMFDQGMPLTLLRLKRFAEAKAMEITDAALRDTAPQKRV